MPALLSVSAGSTSPVPGVLRSTTHERRHVMEETLGVMAAAWGVVMAVSPSLQIRRMLVTRSSRDVSVGYFLLLIPGFLLWGVYGISIDNLVLVVPNAVATLVGLIAVAVALRMRVHDSVPATTGTAPD